MHRLLILLICASTFVACGPAETGGPNGKPDAAPCASLGQLLTDVQSLDSMLAADADWNRVQQHMDEVLVQMHAHVSPDQKECHYLNTKEFPEQPRFLFVENLRSRMVEDTLEGGIYYLIRLRGIFAEDSEITEYFSEELAHVALVNPDCYLRYLQANPGQREMLLHSTRWNYLDTEQLLEAFEARPGAEPIVQFLLQFRAQHEMDL